MTTATPEGHYLSAAGDTELFALDNGTFYLQHVYAQDGTYEGGNGAWYGHGTLTNTGTTVSGTATEFVFAGDLYTGTDTVSGTFSPGASINLTMGSRSFSGSFDPAFLTAAKLSDVAGSYNAPSGQAAGTIDAAGNIALSGLSPCQVTGTLQPHGNDRLYDAQLTFQASSQCTQQARNGIAVLEGSRLLFFMNDGYQIQLRKVS